ncbi:hypothetical protein AGH21_05565 [Klebsiella oxytoca]|nr:hypothetical protein AGH21_05565 [Klebsiella oxytoca]
MMNPVPWLQMTNMISYQGLVRTFLSISYSEGGLCPCGISPPSAAVMQGGYFRLPEHGVYPDRDLHV